MNKCSYTWGKSSWSCPAQFSCYTHTQKVGIFIMVRAYMTQISIENLNIFSKQGTWMHPLQLNPLPCPPFLSLDSSRDFKVIWSNKMADCFEYLFSALWNYREPQWMMLWNGSNPKDLAKEFATHWKVIYF